LVSFKRCCFGWLFKNKSCVFNSYHHCLCCLSGIKKTEM